MSPGDVIALLGIIGVAVLNYFGTVRRLDNADFKIEELRKGRGLILEHWPAPFRRLMGFDSNGNDIHRPPPH